MTEKTSKMIRRRIMITGIIILVLIFVGYLFSSNALKLYDLEQQKIEIAQKTEAEKIRSNQLDEQLRQIGSKSYVEYVARKFLGLYYSDETIIVPVEEEKQIESESIVNEQLQSKFSSY
jgi:cell division protein FtsB